MTQQREPADDSIALILPDGDGWKLTFDLILMGKKLSRFESRHQSQEEAHAAYQDLLKRYPVKNPTLITF